MKSIRILLILSFFSSISYSQNTIESLMDSLTRYLESEHVSGAVIRIIKPDTIFFFGSIDHDHIHKKGAARPEQLFRHFSPLELIKPHSENEFKRTPHTKNEQAFTIKYTTFFLWLVVGTTITLSILLYSKGNRNITELYSIKNPKGLPEEEAKILIASLNHIMDIEKPYLNENLSLKELSKLVNTKERDLSKLLNRNLNTNFYNYINEYRITTFQQKIKTGMENYTIMGLAYDSGFKSKSSFYRAYKKITGSSPSAFKKKIE